MDDFQRRAAAFISTGVSQLCFHNCSFSFFFFFPKQEEVVFFPPFFLFFFNLGFNSFAPLSAAALTGTAVSAVSSDLRAHYGPSRISASFHTSAGHRAQLQSARKKKKKGTTRPSGPWKRFGAIIEEEGGKKKRPHYIYFMQSIWSNESLALIFNNVVHISV